MKRVLAFLALMLILSQARIFQYAIQSGGSASPPGEADYQSENPYTQPSFLPTPGSPMEADNRRKFEGFKNQVGRRFPDPQIEIYRYNIFLKNTKDIDNFNKGQD